MAFFNNNVKDIVSLRQQITLLRKQACNLMNIDMGCIFIACFFTTVFPIKELKAEILRFATIDYCPFTCDPSKEGGKEGIMTEVLRKALHGIGYSVETSIFPYVRAVELVRAGKYDGLVVVGKNYAPDLVYPDKPTLVQPVTFFTVNGTPWRYRGIHSLDEVTVGIIGGYDYADQALNTYLLEYAPTDRVEVLYGEAPVERGLKMLLRNRITAYIDGEYSAVYTLNKMGLQGKISAAGRASTAFEDYTCFSPSHPEAPLLARILSDTISEMKQNGELEKKCLEYGITCNEVDSPRN